VNNGTPPSKQVQSVPPLRTVSGPALLEEDAAYFDREMRKPGQTIASLITGSPTARSCCLNEHNDRLVRQLLEQLGMQPNTSPMAAPPNSGSASSLTRTSSSGPKGRISSALSSMSSSLSSRNRVDSGGGASAPPVGLMRDEFLKACKQLPAYVDTLVSGTVIIGNGRTVLEKGQGALIDRFGTVVRFNDYVIKGEGGTAASVPVEGAGDSLPDYSRDIGTKTHLWVVSDWTCIKMLKKHPHRAANLPVLVAIPHFFMGQPYYHKRKAELEQELKAGGLDQRKRCHFVPEDVVEELIRGRNFGDRWPSSGLITIWHMLHNSPAHPDKAFQQAPMEVAGGAPRRPHLHGFDFFKEIDGKIHYMEDTHTANHHAAEEERICMQLLREGKVGFLV